MNLAGPSATWVRRSIWATGGNGGQTETISRRQGGDASLSTAAASAAQV